MPESTDSNSIISLLETFSPAFQLKSGTDDLKSSERFLSQTAQDTASLQRASHATSLKVLQYIAEMVDRSCTTLETGGGWSTCVFAAHAGKHICVNPDITANEMIRQFLQEHHVPTGELLFKDATSDAALPKLDSACKVDVALIDGNHSFPIPIVDWHYIDLRLKKGGILLVDDSHIRSVGLLCEFLRTEDSYQWHADIGNLTVFKKTAEERVWGWGGQRLNKAPANAKDRPKACRPLKVIRGIRKFLSGFRAQH